jgi:D-3-phosphoglycerate dehydrogenase
VSKAQFRVLVTDKVSGGALGALKGDARFEVVQVDDSKDAKFTEALARAHGLIVRSATKVKGPMLEKAPLLRVIGRAGVGVDNIDLVAATERGIAVLNAPAGNTVSAAELTMALIMSMVRRVAEADAAMRTGVWSKLQGVELRGRTLGLVGAGRIGGEVAKRCRAFGMDVIAYDPYLTDERAAELQVQRAELEDVLTKVDIVSFQLPLTYAT